MRSYENIVPCRIAIYSVIIDVLNIVKHTLSTVEELIMSPEINRLTYIMLLRST